MKYFLLALSCFTLSTFSSVNLAEDRIVNLGRQNYILNCQGCHLPDASGSPGLVPKIKDFAGNFLHVEGGREFIVQVPGAANAPINDQELTDVLNWMLVEFSEPQIPDNFVPYTAEEVGALRRRPLIDVNGTREQLIEKIQNELNISEDSLNNS